MALAAVAALTLAGVIVGLLVNRALGPEFLSRLDANSVGVIDASAARITSQLEVGSAPSALAGGGGFMWAASEADGTVSRIDPVTRAVQTLSLDSDPAGVAYGGGSLWVTMPEKRAVAQIDPRTLKLVQAFPVGNAPGSVAADESGVWVANTLDGTVSRSSRRRVLWSRRPARAGCGSRRSASPSGRAARNALSATRSQCSECSDIGARCGLFHTTDTASTSPTRAIGSS